MGNYDPAKSLAWLIKQLEKGREFAQAGGYTIVDAMMVSKGTNLLVQKAMFKNYRRERRRQTNDHNTWAN